MSPFVRHLPSRDRRGANVPILVRPTTRADTRFWDKFIGPHVRVCVPERADHDWRWSWIVASTSLVARALRQRPAAFTLGVDDHTRSVFVPCAMAFLAGRFRALDEPLHQAVFLWFLAAAPRSFLEQSLPVGMMPGRLGEATLDVAVTYSLSNGMEGRTGLHADDAGGTQLLDWYEQRGMTRLPLDAPLPRRFTTNDGRYFYFSGESALAFSHSLDEFRTESRNLGQDS